MDSTLVASLMDRKGIPRELPALASAAGTFDVLQLTHLRAVGQEATAACLAELGAATRTASLRANRCDLAADATLEQLAAALARLTSLQHVTLPPFSCDARVACRGLGASV